METYVTMQLYDLAISQLNLGAMLMPSRITGNHVGSSGSVLLPSSSNSFLVGALIPISCSLIPVSCPLIPISYK